MIAVLVTAFVFGFDDKSISFNLIYWIMNYIKFFIYSLIALGVYVFAHKYVSSKYGTEAKFDFWKIRRYYFFKSAYFNIKLKIGSKQFIIKALPMWIILPLLLTVLSNGGVYFVGMLSFFLTINPVFRIGRNFTKLTEFEEAKVYAAGPLANILLAIILKFTGIASFNDLIFVNSIVAISYMLPLPGLAGNKVFFGSKLLYVFCFTFILVNAWLLNFLSGLTTLIVAVLAAFLTFIFFLIKIYYP